MINGKKSLVFSKSKFIILNVLRDAEMKRETLHMSVLIKRSKMFRSTLIDNVKELEFLGYLKCYKSEHDKRFIQIELTQKGKIYIDDYLRFCNNNGVEVSF